MSFTSWGSNAGTVSSSGFEDWGSGGWRHKFPDHSGTKDPKTDPERIRRIEYLENKVYQLKEEVRTCDSKIDQAKYKVDQLESRLSRTRDEAYRARERHLSLGNKVAGLKGKREANKAAIRRLEERLRYTNDTWTINDIKSELAQRNDMRWTILDQINNADDAYRSATDKMHTLENKVEEVSRNLDRARDNVWNAKDACRMKKEQLSEHQSELSNLKGGW